MKKILLAFILSVVTLQAGSINIAVAANVSYAINQLVSEFHKNNPQTKVEITLGGSGKLAAQINNGAPYDILMSANMKYPEAIYNNGLGVTKPHIYAQGSLAIFSARKRDFTQGINIVSDAKVRRIAIANPNTAPYGKASIEALKNAKLYKKVKNKFVYAESISQAVAYSVTATDLGFIAKSSLYSKKMQRFKRDINWIEVDPKLYTPINQGIIILKHAEKNSEAKAFYDFILSQTAKDIFLKYGYLVQ